MIETILKDNISTICTPFEEGQKDPIYLIETPFEFSDGDGIQFFAKQHGKKHIQFFDDGLTLFHILGSGLKIDSRKLKNLNDKINHTGATLTPSGEIEINCELDKVQDGFSSMINAIFTLASWETENIGLAEDSIELADEVEIYLREWKPNHPLTKNPSLTGISGREIKFNFLQDNTYIDVISSTPQSSAAMIRKLADVRGISSQAKTNLTVILDNRASKERAKEEASILQQFANVIMVSDLAKTKAQIVA